MKRHVCIIFAAVLVLGLLMVTANARAAEIEVPKIQLGGLIEVGGAWIDYDYDNPALADEDASDLCLTTVELTAEVEVNEWVNVIATFLYEDATSFEGENDETDVTMDVGIVTIGNTEEYPVYLTAGAMYVPFGALLTHFPDDPLMNVPVTLVLGETREKALLIGIEHEGFSVSAYVFNGDMDEFEEDNTIESYGVDVNYSMDDDEAGFDILIGGSYISNVTDSDGLTDAIDEYAAGTVAPFEVEDLGLKDYVAGAAGYLHVGFRGFFLDGEYMTALDELEIEGTSSLLGIPGPPIDEESDLQPSVWNIEAGYNLDWGKNLEIVLKYAGSDEAELLGLPEQRYGICLNQDLFEDVIVSLAYLNDEYENNDEADVVYGQIAVEF